MVIWVMDYCNGSVRKFVLTDERKQELEERFFGCTEDFLYAHEKDMGIRMKDCSWMATTDEQLEVTLF